MSDTRAEPEVFEWGAVNYGWYGVFSGAFKEADLFHKFTAQELEALAKVAAETVTKTQAQDCDASYMPRPGVGEVHCDLHRGHTGPHRGLG
jgi:hypothetical protein